MAELRIDEPRSPGTPFRRATQPAGGWPRRPWDLGFVTGDDGRSAAIACLPDGSPIQDAEGYVVAPAFGAGAVLSVRAEWRDPGPPVAEPDFGDLDESFVACLRGAVEISRDHGWMIFGREDLVISILREDASVAERFRGVLDSDILEEARARYFEGDDWRARLDLVAARRSGVARRPPALDVWPAWVVTAVDAARAAVSRAGHHELDATALLVVELLATHCSALVMLTDAGVETAPIIERIRADPDLRALVEAVEGPHPQRRGGTWWDGLGTVSATIRCGGGSHTVRFERSEFVTEHHDVVAEETLSALDTLGRLPECIEVAHAWMQCFDDDRLQLELGELGDVADGSSQQDDALATARLRQERMRAMPVPLVVQQALARSRRLERAKLGLALMPCGLRATLGMAVARRPPHANAYGHQPIEAARRAGDLLRTRLVAHLGLDSETGAWLAQQRPRQLRGAGRDTYELKSPLVEIGTLLGPGLPPAATAVLLHGRIVGDVSLPQSWLRRVYVRGICTEHLVLEVLESSDDERRLKVNACRWEDDPQPVLRTREAEMTLDESGAWHTRWLDDRSDG